MNNWNNSFCSNRQYLLSRRNILKGISAGFGYMAFAGMSTAKAAADAPLAPKRPHFQPKAKRVMNSTKTRRDGIRLAYELAFAREATDNEMSKAREFLDSVSEEKDRPGQWTVLCQALLASAEFRYID